jgi:hypothetical protein
MLDQTEDNETRQAILLAYVEAEKSTTPDRVQLAYERLLVENALAADYWRQY